MNPCSGASLVAGAGADRDGTVTLTFNPNGNCRTADNRAAAPFPAAGGPASGAVGTLVAAAASGSTVNTERAPASPASCTAAGLTVALPGCSPVKVACVMGPTTLAEGHKPAQTLWEQAVDILAGLWA